MPDSSRPKITRNRKFRTCLPCRRRKLKCDRQSPCSACTRRNAAAGCVYNSNDSGVEEEHNLRLQAEARIESLEQLVLQQLGQPDGTNGSDEMALWSEKGEEYASLPPNEAMYNGSTHWSAMAEGMEELSAHDENDEARDIRSDDGVALLFGEGRPLPYSEILTRYLPLRREADRMVAAYFRCQALVAPFIHTGYFSRLYHQFWLEPASTSPLWTSMLFSIFDISSRTLSTHSETTRNALFAVAAAHCLATGSYFRPQPFAIEGLLLYAQRKCITSPDMSLDLGILFGTLIRLATAQGYHRDPSRTLGLSPFAAEIRRRIWSLAMQLDLLVSFQLGLPSNIQYPTWDTQPPSNFLGSDFDEETTDVPTPRPDTESTGLLFYIAKHKLMAVFEKVLRLVQSVDDVQESDIDDLDRELRCTHANLPTVFQPHSMADSIADTPSTIVTRLCVEFIYHKCLCVLHRKYVIRGRIESVKKCFAAATDLVRRFLDIQEEFQPGGQLMTEKWFITSITWHDFLLGCMALCLALCVTRQAPAAAVAINLPASLELLKRAGRMCEEQQSRSGDTRRVRRLIEATMSQLSGDREDWFQADITMSLDEEWAFLEQFLNLPGDSIDPVLLVD